MEVADRRSSLFVQVMITERLHSFTNKSDEEKSECVIEVEDRLSFFAFFFYVYLPNSCGGLPYLLVFCWTRIVLVTEWAHKLGPMGR